MQKVDFEDCCKELVQRSGGPGQIALERWRSRPGYGEVVRFVESFTHEALFTISHQDVLAVLGRTEHALGNVRATEQIAAIENFTCPFALHHLFHRLVERTGELPTWQRFDSWMNKQARSRWLDEIEPTAAELRLKYGTTRVTNAIRWRLGKFYYSALREIDLLASLRDRGVELRYHLLADVLLRADFWIGDVVVCTYFPNARYRDSQAGRKPPAAAFLGCATPPFTIIDFPIERQGFGKVWLATHASKDALAATLRKSISSPQTALG